MNYFQPLEKFKTMQYINNWRGRYEKKYFKKYKNGRKIILQTGYISKWDYYYTLLVQLIFSILPNSVREFVYEKLLRSNKE